jgi:hypothetical protein
VCAREDGIRRSKDLRARSRKFLNLTNERKQMSIETIKKRIALVAITALSVGLLSATTSLAATADDQDDIDNGDVTISTQTAGTALAVGLCRVDTKASNATTGLVAGNGGTDTTVAVGGKLQFKVATNGTGSLVITGPAVWAGVPVSTSDLTTQAQGAQISSTAKAVNTAGVGTSAIMNAVSVGAVTVRAYDAANGTGTLTSTFGINIVASCAGSDTVSVANSLLVTAASAVQAADGQTDFSATYAEQAYGTDQHINVLLRDAYGADLATEVVLQATATNGALVGIDGVGISSTGVKATVAGSSSGTDIQVAADNTTNPGKALTTTVTVSANGVVIGTKTITILGLAASIDVPQSTVSYGVTSGTTAQNNFRFTVKDDAGNRLELTPAATGAVGGTTYASASGVSAVTTAGADGTAYRKDTDGSGTGYGEGTFTCSSSKSGSQSVTLGFYNAALALVKSNPFTVNCSIGGVATFAVSTDKATYSPGEIATLTIKGYDLLGAPVADSITMGAAYVNLSMPGMTLIGSAATSADAFTAGVRTYKFRVDQSEGSFVGQAQVTASVDTSAKTASYSIKSATGTVTNAEVLKSIVALIASINKQIQALQKLILKR